MSQCEDSFHAEFESYGEMLDFHRTQTDRSFWKRIPLKSVRFFSIDPEKPVPTLPADFAPEVSDEAIRDTYRGTKLFMLSDGEIWPVRDTAYKGILERARISGNSLARLPKEKLASLLNDCFSLYGDDALVLFRNGKITAVHSGGESDYSVMEIGTLLEITEMKLSCGFPGAVFRGGYTDHSVSFASWSLPEQKDELTGKYLGLLGSRGEKYLADTLVPGVSLQTSDTGVSGVKVSAYLMGNHTEISIGSCIEMEHRAKKTAYDLEGALNGLFAKFGEGIEKLEKLYSVLLEFPVNAMTRVCKALKLPAKASCEAVAMFEMANGNVPCTAHDVYLAMQEILFLCRADRMPENRLLTVSENLSRALTIRWSDYDLAKGVNI